MLIQQMILTEWAYFPRVLRFPIVIPNPIAGCHAAARQELPTRSPISAVNLFTTIMSNPVLIGSVGSDPFINRLSLTLWHASEILKRTG